MTSIFPEDTKSTSANHSEPLDPSPFISAKLDFHGTLGPPVKLLLCYSHVHHQNTSTMKRNLLSFF